MKFDLDFARAGADRSQATGPAPADAAPTTHTTAFASAVPERRRGWHFGGGYGWGPDMADQAVGFFVVE